MVTINLYNTDHHGNVEATATYPAVIRTTGDVVAIVINTDLIHSGRVLK